MQHSSSVNRTIALTAAVLALVGSTVSFFAQRPGAEAVADVAYFDYSFELGVPSGGGLDYVHIRMYAHDEPGTDRELAMAEGKAAMLARFPGAVLVEPAEVSAQFKLFATPVRWPQPSASWVYNPSGSTPAMPAESAFEAIRLGAEGWDNAGGSTWHFEFLGTTTVATGCNGDTSTYSRDGTNVVGWGHIVGGHLGYSCHWRSASLVPDTPYFAIQEIDIIFEPTFAYSGASLRALALHEFGHALGLDHTEPPACPGKAMCAGGAAMQFISPREDDAFGVIALYGVAATPTPTATPGLSATPTPPVGPPGARPHRAFGPSVARD